jgi:YD repeat-containing protein
MAEEWLEKLLRIKCGASFPILRSGATTYAYNDRGQITAVRGDASYPLDYVYDAYGRMTQLKTYRNEELTVK